MQHRAALFGIPRRGEVRFHVREQTQRSRTRDAAGQLAIESAEQKSRRRKPCVAWICGRPVVESIGRQIEQMLRLVGVEFVRFITLA